jgi:predicted GIY-YIG superfamily endonuclease
MDKVKAKKNYWLYVLKLEQGKYYVGVTAQTPEKRMEQHVRGFAGAAWTKKYKPLELLDKKELGMMTYGEAEKYEAKVVRKYMDEKGYNNVRGGDLRETRELIKRFGWYFDKAVWQSLIGVLILLIIILLLAIK